MLPSSWLDNTVWMRHDFAVVFVVVSSLKFLWTSWVAGETIFLVTELGNLREEKLLCLKKGTLSLNSDFFDGTLDWDCDYLARRWISCGDNKKSHVFSVWWFRSGIREWWWRRRRRWLDFQAIAFGMSICFLFSSTPVLFSRCLFQFLVLSSRSLYFPLIFLFCLLFGPVFLWKSMTDLTPDSWLMFRLDLTFSLLFHFFFFSLTERTKCWLDVARRRSFHPHF